MYNPSLRQESRYEPATVIPLKKDSSILDWLAANGRLIAREKEEYEANFLEEDEEISDLMEVDDHVYEEEEEEEQVEDYD
jgi:hypothetical protein